MEAFKINTGFTVPKPQVPIFEESIDWDQNSKLKFGTLEALHDVWG